MGCYSTSCILSNLSISNGRKPIYFFILQPTKIDAYKTYTPEDIERYQKMYDECLKNPEAGIGLESAKYLLDYAKEHQYDGDWKGSVSIEPQSTTCSNDGSYLFYQPFYLPVEASYDEYGGLEDIVRNEVTEHLEQHFDTDIEELLEGITEGNSQYSGCWMYKDIFDQTARLEAEKNDLSKEYCYLHVLKHLGFTYSHTEDSLERYNKIWVYKDAPIGVTTDGTWFNSLYDTRHKCIVGKQGMGYTKDNLKAFCSMNRKNGYSIDYRELFNQTKGFNSQAICLKYDLQKDVERTFDTDKRLQKNLVISKTMSDKHTKDIYNSKELFELAAAVMNVGSAMYSLNKFWFPSFSGPQCGDWNMQSKFNAVVKNFIKEYRK